MRVKLSEIHSEVPLFSNPAYNVLKCLKSWRQICSVLQNKKGIVLWIGEQWDIKIKLGQFSMNPNKLVVPGKLLELHAEV